MNCIPLTVSLEIERVEFSSVCIALTLVAAAALLLKNLGFRGAGVFVCAAIVFLIRSFSGALTSFGETYDFLVSRADVAEYARAAAKVVGIGYLSGICSDVCREMGEGGIAKCIGVITRLELVAVAAPFILKMLETAFALIGE